MSRYKVPDTHENSLDYLFPPHEVFHEGSSVSCREAYLPSEIDEFEEINNIIRLLRSQEVSGELIHLYVSGYGGDTLIGMKIINAINRSQAIVQTVVDANCYSMHTVIALSQAATVEIEDCVQFMFHESQINLSGGVDNVSRDLAAIRREDGLLDMYVRPYLTKEEYAEMQAGRNIYILGEEMKRRISEGVHPRKKRKKAKLEEGDSE